MQRQQQHRSQKEWKEILTEWKKSGLTGPDFSRRHGLNHLSLYRWSSRLGFGKQHQGSAASESFTRAQTSATNPLLATPTLRIIPVPEHILPSVDGSLGHRKSTSLSLVVGRRFRVVVPDGFSPATLGKLIQTLEALR